MNAPSSPQSPNASLPNSSTGGCGGGGFIAILVLLVLQAGGCSAWQGVSLNRSFRIGRYPTVEGKVLGSEVRSFRSGRHLVYEVTVEYGYRVGGQEYSSKTYGFKPMLTMDLPNRYETGFEGRAQELLRKHPRGAAVKVYHDPKDPAKACLDPTYYRLEMSIKLTFSTLEFLVVGFLLVCFLAPSRSSKARPPNPS